MTEDPEEKASGKQRVVALTVTLVLLIIVIVGIPILKCNVCEYISHRPDTDLSPAFLDTSKPCPGCGGNYETKGWQTVWNRFMRRADHGKGPR